MGRKRYKPEQIISMLREAEVLIHISQTSTIKVGTPTALTSYAFFRVSLMLMLFAFRPFCNPIIARKIIRPKHIFTVLA